MCMLFMFLLAWVSYLFCSFHTGSLYYPTLGGVEPYHIVIHFVVLCSISFMQVHFVILPSVGWYLIDCYSFVVLPLVGAKPYYFVLYLCPSLGGAYFSFHIVTTIICCCYFIFGFSSRACYVELATPCFRSGDYKRTGHARFLNFFWT